MKQIASRLLHVKFTPRRHQVWNADIFTHAYISLTHTHAKKAQPHISAPVSLLPRTRQRVGAHAHARGADSGRSHRISSRQRTARQTARRAGGQAGGRAGEQAGRLTRTRIPKHRSPYTDTTPPADKITPHDPGELGGVRTCCPESYIAVPQFILKRLLEYIKRAYRLIRYAPAYVSSTPPSLTK